MYTENICSFGVNTINILIECNININVFITRDEQYLWYSENYFFLCFSTSDAIKYITKTGLFKYN